MNIISGSFYLITLELFIRYILKFLNSLFLNSFNMFISLCCFLRMSIQKYSLEIVTGFLNVNVFIILLLILWSDFFSYLLVLVLFHFCWLRFIISCFIKVFLYPFENSKYKSFFFRSFYYFPFIWVNSSPICWLYCLSLLVLMCYFILWILTVDL